MKRLFVILNLFCAISYGQDSSTVKPAQFRRFSLGINFSPDYCFRTLVNTDNSDLSKTIFDYDNQIDRPKLGYTAGVVFSFALSRHFEIQAGIQYSNKGFATQNSDLVFSSVPPRRGTITSTAPPVNGRFIYNYNYIDLPVKATYFLGTKKLRFVVGLGVTTNIFLSKVNIFTGNDANGKTYRSRSTDSYNSYNRLNFSPAVSFGIDYKINKKMNLRIEPTVRYGVVTTLNAPILTYLWSGGLNISFLFGL